MSEEGVEDDDEFDWEIEQFPYNEVSESALNPQYHYGFGDLRSGVFQRLQVCCLSKRPGYIGFYHMDILFLVCSKKKTWEFFCVCVNIIELMYLAHKVHLLVYIHYIGVYSLPL